MLEKYLNTKKESVVSFFQRKFWKSDKVSLSSGLGEPRSSLKNSLFPQEGIVASF